MGCQVRDSVKSVR